MILPKLHLQTRANKKWVVSGIDSLKNCKDRDHFLTYPHKIIYQYNSRGFRDAEWPSSLDELQNSIWCLGDSFTVGIGAPIEHTWVNLLQKQTGKRCINISLDGASNAWIARHAAEILEIIKPKYMILHWSYLWRGENLDSNLSDEDRRLFDYVTDPLPAIKLFKQLTDSVDQHRHNTVVVHSVIPKFSFNVEIHRHWNECRSSSWPSTPPSTNSEFISLPGWLHSELELLKIKDLVEYSVIINDIFNSPQWIREFDIIDFARDKFHYDKLTATLFVEQLLGYNQFD